MHCDDCLNKHLCFKCQSMRLYKGPKIRSPLRSRPEKHKPGIELEIQVERMNRELASRRPGSGAFSGLKGDVRTPEGLEECKKCYTLNAKGEQSFTIKKEWLEKIRREALQNCGMGTLPFQFANDTTVYVIKRYDDELADRLLLRELMTENAQLREQSHDH